MKNTFKKFDIIIKNRQAKKMQESLRNQSQNNESATQEAKLVNDAYDVKNPTYNSKNQDTDDHTTDRSKMQ
jgi:hypothetical protein